MATEKDELPYHCDVCSSPGYGDAHCSPLCSRSVMAKEKQATESQFSHSMVDKAEANIRQDYSSGKISTEQFQKEMRIVANARLYAEEAE